MDKLIVIALVDEGSLDVNLKTLNITSDDEGHESLESPEDDGGGPGGDAVPYGVVFLWLRRSRRMILKSTLMKGSRGRRLLQF